MMRRGAVMLLLSLPIASIGCIIRGTQADPPSRSDVSGVWIGLIEDAWNTVIRMELKSDGSGVLACTDGTRNARVYEIQEWRVDKWDMRIALDQIESRADTVAISISGRIESNDALSLSIAIQRYESSWERSTVRMRRESDLERDWAALKTRMTNTSRD